MLTKDISQELEAVLSQLVAEGKEPSVALVKNRLSHPIPMPAIISVMKSWKSTKRVPKVEVTAQNEVADEQRITQLEQQVNDLLLRIEKLESQLAGNK